MKTPLVLSVLVCSELLLAANFAAAYSRVSKNGQSRSSNTRDIAFTISPVYVASTPANIDLKPGEAVDLPSTPKYSTLDTELLAQLDSSSKAARVSGRTRAQDRFHPAPVNFHTNSLRQQPQKQTSADQSQQQQLLGAPTSQGDVIYAKPVVSMSYDYPSFDAAKPAQISSKPTGPKQADSFPAYSSAKFPDSFSNDGPPTFDFDQPPGHYEHPFDEHESPYAAHHEEIIYDHIPDDHYYHHHHHETPPPPPPPPRTTEEPEMMDQRLNKRPYSYYYIGKKLWYVPLYFSIYFIIYIAALVLKSVARHKINFPASLAAAAGADNARRSDSPAWMSYVTPVLESIERYGPIVAR